jgi:hypothetical protein
MTKKLIITEEQYSRLSKFIVETKFDTLIQQVAKPNDVIKIDFKNSTNNFRVLSNDMGQIKMDNIDKGANINYRYFMTYTGLEGNQLSVKRVHKIKEKDKLNDVKSWATINVNDIKNIEIIRDGKVIDKVDEPVSKAEKDEKNKNVSGNNFKVTVDDSLAIILNQLAEGKGLKLNMTNGEEVLFCCMSRSNGVFTLELKLNTKIDALKKWDSFILSISGSADDESDETDGSSLYEKNINVVKTTDGGKSFNLLVDVNSGSKKNKIWINGIIGLSVTPSCESTDEHDKEEEKDETEIIDNGKKAMEAILNDPLLKQAFYKQPNLWQLFKAELQGKKAPGTGILPTIQLVGDYEKKRISERLGAEFIEGKELKYKFDQKISIPYVNKNGEQTSLVIDKDRNYIGKVAPHELGVDGVIINWYGGGKTIIYSLLVKKPTGIADTYFCDLIKRDETLERAEHKEEVKVRFFSVEGSNYGYKSNLKKQETK